MTPATAKGTDEWTMAHRNWKPCREVGDSHHPWVACIATAVEHTGMPAPAKTLTRKPGHGDLGTVSPIHTDAQRGGARTTTTTRANGPSRTNSTMTNRVTGAHARKAVRKAVRTPRLSHGQNCAAVYCATSSKAREEALSLRCPETIRRQLIVRWEIPDRKPVARSGRPHRSDTRDVFRSDLQRA